MLVTKKEPRLEKLPHRRGKCVSQQEGNRRAICSSSVKIPAVGQDLAWFCLGESQGLRKLLRSNASAPKNVPILIDAPLRD